MEKFDWIVIGGGSGGLSVIEKALEFNKKCLLIDPNPLGGTCVNTGCIPKKMMWFLAEVYEKSRLLKDYQITDKTTLRKFSFSKFVQEREKIIKNINYWYENKFVEKVKIVRGEAFFVEPHCVQVEKNIFQGERVVIATGSQAFVPEKIEGSELGLTSEGFFALQEVPPSACFVGSGYIALELASIVATLQEIQYGKIQTEVVIRSHRILKKIEKEATDFLQKQLEKRGINFIFDRTIKKVEKEDKFLLIETNTSEKIKSNCLVWATGRTPNSNKLKLEKTKINVDDRGYIETNDFFETKEPFHYAIGDVTNKPQLTPIAIQCGRRLVRQIYENKTENKVSFEIFPTAIFTHPPLSTIGLNEEEARKKGIDIKTFSTSFIPMIYNFSASASETFIKLICEKKTQKILGLHMVGESVDEILQGFAVAIKMGATKKDFDSTFALHPTSAEEIVTLKPIV